jgi:hypothetical protein
VRSDQELLGISLNHMPIPSILFGLKLSGRPEFHSSTILHHQYFITLSQSGQPMGYCQDSALLKLIGYDSLYNGIILNIDVGSCFVNKDDLTVFEKSPTYTQKLFLAS